MESVAFFRDQSRQTNVIPILSNGTLSGGSNLETEFDHSLRSTIGIALGNWYRVDFTWLKRLEWNDRLAATDGTQSERIDFLSQMNSSEINLRRRVKLRDWPQHYPDYWNSFEFSTLLGFRHFELSERLHHQAQSPTGTSSTVVDTSNEMAGIQLGGLAQWLYEDRGWLDLEVKGAMLSNDLKVASGPVSFQADESQTAFLIDASLMCNYQLSECFTLRLGYNLLWVTGTALATENVPPSGATPALTASHDGESVFHGPSLGFVFAR